MKKALILISYLLVSYQLFAQQAILKTQPRLFYNYLLFTDTILNFQQLQTTLPDGARIQLIDDLAKVKKTKLIKFANRGDSTVRLWYVNNTIFIPCKLVVLQSKKVIAEIAFWPNAESVEIDLKLLANGHYTFAISDGKQVLEEGNLEVERD
jgi:hypothetical protein